MNVAAGPGQQRQDQRVAPRRRLYLKRHPDQLKVLRARAVGRALQDRQRTAISHGEMSRNSQTTPSAGFSRIVQRSVSRSIERIRIAVTTIAGAIHPFARNRRGRARSRRERDEVVGAAVAPRPGARQRPAAKRRRGEQHRVGGRQPRLQPDDAARGHEQPGDKRRDRRRERHHHPPRQKRRGERRRQATATAQPRLVGFPRLGRATTPRANRRRAAATRCPRSAGGRWRSRRSQPSRARRPAYPGSSPSSGAIMVKPGSMQTSATTKITARLRRGERASRCPYLSNSAASMGRGR